MARTHNNPKQVSKETICRLRYVLIDKKSGKVVKTESFVSPVMLLVARDEKSDTGYCIRGLLNCGNKLEGQRFITACTNAVSNVATAIFAPGVGKIVEEMKKRRARDPLPEFSGVGGDDNT